MGLVYIKSTWMNKRCNSPLNSWTENLTKALYTYQLHPFEGITFNFDYATSGLGCTARSVFTQYQVPSKRYDFIFSVKPVKQ